MDDSYNPMSLAQGNVEGIKYFFDENGVIQWRGFSGFIQWFYRWPFGFTQGMKDHPLAVRFNQIFWNVMIFVVVFGFIYKAMIDYRMMEDVSNAPINKERSSFLQGFYFSTMTTTTLGMAGVVPKTFWGQIVVFIHLTLMVLFNIIWLCKFSI